MKGLILFAVISAVGMIHAGTYGTLSFSDIDELVLQRKEDFDRIKADFELFGIGDARMINRSENVKLNGTRMGPYNFFIKPKGTPDPYCYELRIETRATFIDSAGNQVSLAKAADFHERVTGIKIRPVAAEKCFTPGPDQNEFRLGGKTKG